MARRKGRATDESALTKLASYQGTSCDVDVVDYVIRRINGYQTPEVERAVTPVENVTLSVFLHFGNACQPPPGPKLGS
jgi:hypothetical protein